MSQAIQAVADTDRVELTFIDNQGVHDRVSAAVGETLMQVATFYGISGIDADCGGSCACGTCRVLLDQELLGQVPAADEDELAVLEFVTDGGSSARLGCQVVVTAAFHDLTIKVAT